MEIKYTNFPLSKKIYGQNEITAIFDHDGTFLYETIYDLKIYKPQSRLSVNLFLRFGANTKKRKLIFDMLSELEITKDLEKRPLRKLSTTELYKVLLIKLCISPAKNIILENLDTHFNYKDMMQILKTLKNHLPEIEKNVIFTTNKPDNSIENVDRYIVVRNGQITYNGKDHTALDVPTSINTFTELANSKGAKLKKYKEANDLLKAIYRSIKK